MPCRAVPANKRVVCPHQLAKAGHLLGRERLVQVRQPQNAHLRRLKAPLRAIGGRQRAVTHMCTHTHTCAHGAHSERECGRASVRAWFIAWSCGSDMTFISAG